MKWTLYFSVVNNAIKFFEKFYRETLGNFKSRLIAKGEVLSDLWASFLLMLIFYSVYFMSLTKSVSATGWLDLPQRFCMFLLGNNDHPNLRGSLISSASVLNFKNNGFTKGLGEYSLLSKLISVICFQPRQWSWNRSAFSEMVLVNDRLSTVPNLVFYLTCSPLIT